MGARYIIRKDAFGWTVIDTSTDMQSYDDTEQVWQEMIAKSQIDVHELLDQAEFSIEVL